MTVVITGGAGFLGQRLARALLQKGVLRSADGRPEPIDRLVLVDVARPAGLTDSRLFAVEGDVADPALLRQVIDARTPSIFHLAAIVSGMAEADFDLGLRINVDAFRQLLDVCWHLSHTPRIVFTSSVAVYGARSPRQCTRPSP